MNLPITIDLAVDVSQTVYAFTIESNNEALTMTTDSAINVTIIDTPEYQGVYTVTPSAHPQTLLTADLKCTQDIIVNPIPSNYGLITWNGTAITVS